MNIDKKIIEPYNMFYITFLKILELQHNKNYAIKGEDDYERASI